MTADSEHLICARCGYNLRGLPGEGRCPECGAPIAISQPADPVFVRKPDVDTPLARPTPCVDCGMVLMAQTTHGSCPTCQAPVWYSLYGNWLRASNPEWLRRVRSGVTLWFWVIVGACILGCLGGITGAVVVGAMGAAGSLNPDKTQTVVMQTRPGRLLFQLFFPFHLPGHSCMTV